MSETSKTRPEELILVVDDESAVRELLCAQMQYLGYSCRTAPGAEDALAIVHAEGRHPALVLSDVHMPVIDGVGLLHELKRLDEKIQVVMVSGLQDLEVVRRCLREGAYDYLIKPFELDALSNTVTRALERNRLLRENEAYRQNLERMVLDQTREIRQTRDIAIMTLAKLAESRDSETGLHLERISAFCRRLGEELRQGPYAKQISDAFVIHLFKSSALHDIGKVGIPDSILRKPGPLTREEFEIMQGHTTIGGDTLRSVIEQYDTRSFLHMGMEIAYSHHERWNGSGYPAELVGEAIPLSARIVALADAYDAITSDRPYKAASDHPEAVRRISVDRGEHFDPVLVDAFLFCQADFDRIRRELRPEPRAAAPDSKTPTADERRVGAGAVSDA